MKIRLTLLTASYAPDSGILQRRINFRVAQLASYGAFYCAVLDMTFYEFIIIYFEKITGRMENRRDRTDTS